MCRKHLWKCGSVSIAYVYCVDLGKLPDHISCELLYICIKSGDSHVNKYLHLYYKSSQFSCAYPAVLGNVCRVSQHNIDRMKVKHSLHEQKSVVWWLYHHCRRVPSIAGSDAMSCCSQFRVLWLPCCLHITQCWPLFPTHIVLGLSSIWLDLRALLGFECC